MTFPETAGRTRPRPTVPGGTPEPPPRRSLAALLSRPFPDFPTAALPGLAVCLGVAVLAWGSAQLLPGVSPLLVAILAGALWRNLAPVPARLDPGVAVSGKRLLRAGIVLLGVQISLASVLGLGAGVLAVVVLSVAVTFLATLWIGQLLGIGLAQRLLIASGFSICGAAAVAGVDGVTRAKEEEVATAIALVVLFGTLMIPLVPFLGGALGLPEETLGLWIGASTHEVAQVVAAGVSIHLRRQTGTAGDRAKRPPIVPLFILGFVAAMALRTTGLLPEAVLAGTQGLQTLLLAAAMFALGLGVHLKSLLRLGFRPILLGAASTAVILATSLGGIAALGL